MPSTVWTPGAVGVSFVVVLLAVTLFEEPRAQNHVAEKQHQPQCIAAVAETVVATVEGRPITLAELDDHIGARLARVRTEEYQLRSRALDELIEARVLQIEAQRLGVSEQVLLSEVRHAATGEDPRTLATRVYNAFSGRFPGMPPATAIPEIARALESQRLEERRATALASLQSRVAIERRLTPFRITFEAGEFPAVGPASAAVEIVEFSDFQCPFCAKASDALSQVLRAYPNDVRLVFRHFPLNAIHADAARAAEAAACAGDQARFWDMHDAMFRNQKALQLNDLSRLATEMGMDRGEFNACLSNAKHRRTWQRDLKDGETFGVNGTPTLFINGRLFMGPVSVEALSEVIEEEKRFKTDRSPERSARRRPGGLAP